MNKTQSKHKHKNTIGGTYITYRQQELAAEEIVLKKPWGLQGKIKANGKFDGAF